LSLMVTPDLLEQAKTGKVRDADFVACIAESLPYAWSMVSKLAEELRAETGNSAISREVPQTDEEWGQMFRMMASDSIRAAIERHYGMRLAFQNCCTVGVFEPDAEEARIEFTSPEAQVLNQKPELRNC
jgi:NucS shadow ORF